MERTLQQLRGEFLEMPGLRLTLDQARRLCGIEAGLCKAAVDALVDARFLCVRPDGTYSRLTDLGEPTQPPKKRARTHMGKPFKVTR